MALFDDVFSANTAKGVAVGLGVAALAPLALVSLAGASKPLARAAIKSGIIFYDKGREACAEFAEVVDDLVAEARAEIEQQQAAVRRPESAGAADDDDADEWS